MIREVVEGFRPRAETGDARFGEDDRSPWAEGEVEAAVPLAVFASWMGSMLGDPLDTGSWDEDGGRKALRAVDVSKRLLRAST